MHLSPMISSFAFLARSQTRTVLSCTSIRSFATRSFAGCFFFSSSSSSFSFSFALRASSSSGSSSSFLSSSLSMSFRRSFISWSSWNFSGSPPLSGCSSKAIFLYILLTSSPTASGWRPKNASADRFCSALNRPLALSLHFWILLTSSSVASTLDALRRSSSSSVLMVISSNKNAASRRPNRCLNSASVKRRMGCFVLASP
mmetsp:Transcript_44464/g.118063  ORF Transcript_44464/g.118063 Transcript_44464/m.118063 type:complete len:201 (+) Transcript_44464:1041-1643(+)